MDMDTDGPRLNIEPLQNAVTAFEKSVNAYHASALSADEDTMDTMCSGVIKKFEVAYDLCWKYMKKWMEINIGFDAVEYVTRREFYRIARENRLISDVKDWWGFHEVRIKAAHAYSETVVEEVFNAAVKFIDTAKGFVADFEGMV